VEAQKVQNRPVHLLNDQDLLTALLGSKRFERIPLKLLRRGTDIVQDIPGRGYAVGERISNFLRGRVPPMLHAQGDCKPWLANDPKQIQKLKAALLRTNVELSPYFSEARTYKRALGEAAPCLEFRSPLARFFKLMTFGNSTLQGLPLAAAYTALSKIARMGRRDRKL
jgi:hypothetical protein